MDAPGHEDPLVVTDPAINIAPDLDAKVDIIQNAVDLARAMGAPEVRVAILKRHGDGDGEGPSTIGAAALCKMAERGQMTGAVLDVPLALDNAISPEAAAIKKIVSPVPGRANILVVPDLEAGNMLARSLSFLAGADGRRRRDRARRARPDHSHEPGRLAPYAPGVLRRGGDGGLGAPQGGGAVGSWRDEMSVIPVLTPPAVKAALEAVCRYLAYELGPMRIRVHAISPGPLKTHAASGLKDFDRLLNEAAHKAPLGQLVDIMDVG